MKNTRSIVAFASLACFAALALGLASGGAWAQGHKGGGGGGGGGSPFGGSPFPSTPSTPSTPTVTPSTPSSVPSTPIGSSSGGGSPGAGLTPVAADPLSTPIAPGAGTPPPVDRFRELHGHAHAHLCKATGCEQYCDGRERAIAADKRENFVKQCRSYCMEKC
jgi:hypothetical protein